MSSMGPPATPLLSAEDTTHHSYFDGQLCLESGTSQDCADRHNTQIVLRNFNIAEQHLDAAMQSLSASLKLLPRSLGLAVSPDETDFLGTARTFSCHDYDDVTQSNIWMNNICNSCSAQRREHTLNFKSCILTHGAATGTRLASSRFPLWAGSGASQSVLRL
ncbi:hypothetical protein E4T38_01098 [Aureobasidium subglaciale]|nr:hypothetical protein E4T38_01098 [Aureobasidium subglaciale]KAI5230238.1 hypothetical protein E4T40_01099 [Aureobasidium subglaciale]KAI5233567.1 hypothetical protein E4T41_01097 [Aureobasidium subglaciale]KAI5266984.1 hypothetical protein E4T46_01097 [Aureobasidium subglaciale]